MPQCDYGCEREGVKFFTSTNRWCCSMSVNACPAKKERDASKKRGKNPFEGRVHPRGMLGKHSWNAGQNLSPVHRENIRKALIDNPNVTGIASTPEKEAQRRLRIHEASVRDGNIGGYREGSGWTKWFQYDSPSAGKVFLNGTWEVAYAQYLDAQAISWRRNRTSFPYEWEGKLHKYYPDFYLVQNDEFIEVKGRVVPRDQVKWDAVRKTHKLIVYLREDLIKLGVF